MAKAMWTGRQAGAQNCMLYGSRYQIHMYQKTLKNFFSEGSKPVLLNFCFSNTGYLSFLFKIIFIFIFLLCVCVCMIHVCRCPSRPEKNTESPRAEVIDSYDLIWMLRTKPGSSIRALRQVFLTAEPSVPSWNTFLFHDAPRIFVLTSFHPAPPFSTMTPQNLYPLHSSPTSSDFTPVCIGKRLIHLITSTIHFSLILPSH